MEPEGSIHSVIGNRKEKVENSIELKTKTVNPSSEVTIK